MKTQQIRLLDVVLIGPLMVRSGWLNRDKAPITSYVMLFMGGATVAYNLKNYLEKRKQELKP